MQNFYLTALPLIPLHPRNPIHTSSMRNIDVFLILPPIPQNSRTSILPSSMRYADIFTMFLEILRLLISFEKSNEELAKIFDSYAIHSDKTYKNINNKQFAYIYESKVVGRGTLAGLEPAEEQKSIENNTSSKQCASFDKKDLNIKNRIDSSEQAQEQYDSIQENILNKKIEYFDNALKNFKKLMIYFYNKNYTIKNRDDYFKKYIHSSIAKYQITCLNSKSAVSYKKNSKIKTEMFQHKHKIINLINSQEIYKLHKTIYEEIFHSNKEHSKYIYQYLVFFNISLKKKQDWALYMKSSLFDRCEDLISKIISDERLGN